MADGRRLALITGASEGIGAELARIMAAAGHDLALVARRQDRLDALAEEIAAAGAPRPLTIPCDLLQPQAVDTLLSRLEAAGAQVDILVNNAGYGLHGSAHRLERAEQIGMIDLNIRVLTDLTLRLLPQLVSVRGRILQVASVAAFLPGPHMAVYYATKAFVLSFGEALAQELKETGVSVSVLCPGPTKTGFQARAGLDATLFKMMRPMNARDVAQAGYDGMMAGRRTIFPGPLNGASAILARIAPRMLLLPLVARLQAARKN
jgi:short-subunit dehydrogenase